MQRCRAARVDVSGRAVGEIGPGLCAFVAAGRGDDDAAVTYIADKLGGLRVFPAEPSPGAAAEGGPSPRMTASVRDVGGAILVVPQFTLYGDARRGRRPDFGAAAAPDAGRALLEDLLARLRAAAIPVATGVFGADMTVQVENWGPVTILLDSARAF